MGENLVYKTNHLSVNQWMGIMLLLSIPVVNVVLLFVWAFGGGEYPNRILKNFSRGILKLSAILIGLTLAILIGLGGITSAIMSPSTVGTTLMDFPNPSAESKIAFDKIVYRTDYGLTTVSGETTNHDNKAHSYTLIVTFYDQNQNIVGTAMGVVNNIEPGQTKTFEAISQDSMENVTNYRVNIDSLIH